MGRQFAKQTVALWEGGSRERSPLGWDVRAGLADFGAAVGAT